LTVPYIRALFAVIVIAAAVITGVLAIDRVAILFVGVLFPQPAQT
jgi:hypothetical protein